MYAVASHDTASAFAAVPVDEHAAMLSSGTWSLLGLELPEPVLTGAAREANLTNERGDRGHDAAAQERHGAVAAGGVPGAHGATRPTRSCTGWREQAPEDVPLFDPDHDEFLAPGDMPARIAAACERTGQPAPADVGATVRGILVSLACKYRWTLERLEAVSGRDIHRIHVIGGGARNKLLCRLTADLCGREVLAGPVEATALGNVLVQARGAGELASLAELRAVAAASAEPDRARAVAGAGGETYNASWPSPRPPDRGEDTVTDVEARLRELVIETPSWGYGDSGTRFGTFPQPGRPRDVFERVDDAAEVHRLTGTAGAVALHFPWDAVDDYGALRAHIEARGLRVGAVNPNLFQDPDYKLGSITHPDARGAREGGRPPRRVPRHRRRARLRRAVAVVRRRHQLPGPGRPARAPRAGCSTRSSTVYEQLPADQELLVEYKLFEPAFYATDLADWGSALLACQKLGERARVLSTSATTRRA